MITAPTNPTKVAILQILLAGPAPGLDIQRAMQGDDLPNLLRPSAPYHALWALEDDGYLESFEGELLPERGNRPRRYYRLTEKGLVAAQLVAAQGGREAALVAVRTRHLAWKVTLALAFAAILAALVVAGWRAPW